MQIQAIPRVGIAGAAMLAVLAMWPREGLSQHCRRSCKAGERRDARGCCIPKAEEAEPKSPPRKRHRSRQEQEAKPSDTNRGSAAPEMREQPSNSKRERRRRVRPQREAASQSATGSLAQPAPAIQAPEPLMEQDESESTPDALSGTSLETPASGAEQTADAAASDSGHTEALAGDSHGLVELPGEQDASAKPDRRWSVSLPWALIASGAIVSGVGIVLVATQRDDGRGNLGPIMIATGSVALATGMILFTNQSAASTSKRSTARAFVAPTLSPKAAGITAVISF